MLKGLIHAHSTYSDGEFTLPELKTFFVSRGCSFLCMTDHAEAFNREKLRAYLEELESLSDPTFLFVPGWEFACDQGMHILGYGVTVPSGTTDPQAVIRHIDQRGGISVIAHPKDSMFPWIETFKTLPQGIEAWNTKYDGQYAPRVGTFRLVQKLQERQPNLRAFYGQDLHWKKQYKQLFVVLATETLRRDAILKCLATGSFVGVKDDLELSSQGALSNELLHRFAEAQERSMQMRGFFGLGKRLLDRIGMSIPEAIKAQLRRIF